MSRSPREWDESTKWVLGITASVIGALIVFWATNEGPLKPTPTPTPRPLAHVAIAAFALPFFVKSTENEEVPITVSNDGDAPALRCMVMGDVGIGDPEFSVAAHSQVTVNWTLPTYQKKGDQTFTVWIECANATSSPVSKGTVGI